MKKSSPTAFGPIWGKIVFFLQNPTQSSTTAYGFYSKD